MTSAAVLAAALVSTALAQVSYKLFFLRGRRPWIFIGAMGLFVVAQVLFFLALTRLDIGVVYMSTGLVHVLVLALARLVLKEPVTRHHLIAVTFIAGGLILYAW